MEVGLDLTKTKIKKFDEFIVKESSSFNLEKAREAAKNCGLDLTKEQTNNIIDLTKYGKDIE